MAPNTPEATCPWRLPTRRIRILALLLLALAAPAGLTTALESRQPYVVVLGDGADGNAALSDGGFRQLAQATTQLRLANEREVEHVRRIAARNGIRAGDIYTSAVKGFSAELTPGQLRRVSNDPAVEAVMPDEPIQLDDLSADLEAGSVRTTTNPGSRVQPGVKRVGARTPRVLGFAGRNSRINADVAILDSGVERDHPDLNVVGGYNCTGRNREKWDDTMGHGTHVAGIVGALDNRIGVTGVAPGARIWSVKVLDRNGKGFMSWIVCGIDWVTAQRQPGNPTRPLIEVANMSLSFGLPGRDDRACGLPSNDTVHMAICRSVNKGTVYVAAAGNNAHNARRNRPGAYEEVITVSAMADYDGRGGGLARASDSCPYWSLEPDDAFASFSNYGPDIDLIAPGKCVLSTYPGERYAWMSGTSMATPHVSGAAAIYRAMFPRATPAQVRMALQAIGRLDWRTETDPDRVAEKAVWIGNFRVTPDFGIEASAPTEDVAPGNRLAIPVSVVRIGGFDDRVAISLANPPSGFSAARVTTRRHSATLVVNIDSRTRMRRHALTVVARSGELARSATIVVSVRLRLPEAAFVSPRDGLTVQWWQKVLVSWTESTFGAGLASRRLERQVGRIRTPGTCDGVRYRTESTRQRAGDVTEKLPSGYCYRWRLTIANRAGQSTTAHSGSVLVDSTAPRQPAVSLAGTEIAINLNRLGVDEVYARSGTVWVRGGVGGSADLDVRSFDRESGIVRNAAAARGSGWRVRWIGKSVDGRLRLYYSPSGGTGEMRFTSLNGAGLESAVSLGRLMRDTSRPKAVEWVSAPGGTTRTTYAPNFRLDWRGGSDDGSGLSARHIVRRYRAPLRRNGTFPRLGFTQDGPFRLLSDRTSETDLKPGFVYVWSVRTLDNVGNYATSAISGYVIVEKRR